MMEEQTWKEKTWQEKTWKGFVTIMLIVKDVIRLTGWRLIATILISICINNGWILPDNSEQISYKYFWELYHALLPYVLTIMFHRCISGAYIVKETISG